MGTIVVGVDGSEESHRALEWALEEARIRGVGVRALHGWTYPTPVGTFEAVVPAAIHVDFEEEAAEILARAIKDATGGGNEDVEIRTEVVQMSPARALIRASRDADLLVIGSRGLGGFRGLLLGSVGQQCSQHAYCPLVIIPHSERAQS